MTPGAERPSLTEDSDALARDYDRVSVDRQFLSGKMLVRDLAVAAGERVLDVGCGTGLLAEHIAGRSGPAATCWASIHCRCASGLPWQRGTISRSKVADAYDLAAIPAAVSTSSAQRRVAVAAGEVRAAARIPARAAARRAARHQHRAKGPRTPFQELVSAVLARPPFNAYARPPGGLTHRVDEQDAPDVVRGRLRGEVDRGARMVRSFASPELLVRYSEASSFGNLLAHLPAELRPPARERIAREAAALAAPDGSISQSSRRMVALAVRR